MIDGHTFPEPKHPAQALGWLDLLTEPVPDDVKLEVSRFLLIVALVAVWTWRHPRGEAGRPKVDNPTSHSPER